MGQIAPSLVTDRPQLDHRIREAWPRRHHRQPSRGWAYRRAAEHLRRLPRACRKRRRVPSRRRTATGVVHSHRNIINHVSWNKVRNIVAMLRAIRASDEVRRRSECARSGSSGEYFGRYRTVARAFSIASRMAGAMWIQQLSVTTMSLRRSVGTRHCST
jgi:hypothetical protein